MDEFRVGNFQNKTVIQFILHTEKNMCSLNKAILHEVRPYAWHRINYLFRINHRFLFIVSQILSVLYLILAANCAPQSSNERCNGNFFLRNPSNCISVWSKLTIFILLQVLGLGGLFNNGYYPNQRPYSGYYPYNSGYYPGGGYPYGATGGGGGYYPNSNGFGGGGYGTNVLGGSGFGGNGFGSSGFGGYGGYGGNGGLSSYSGYGNSNYGGHRNLGYGYYQGSNAYGFLPSSNVVSGYRGYNWICYSSFCFDKLYSRGLNDCMQLHLYILIYIFMSILIIYYNQFKANSKCENRKILKIMSNGCCMVTCHCDAKSCHK